MTHKTDAFPGGRDLSDILSRDPAEAISTLGLADAPEQSKALTALSIAHFATLTLNRISEVRKLYELVPLAEKVAQDFTDNAYIVTTTRKTLGDPVSPEIEAENLLYGDGKPGVAKLESQADREARITNMANMIRALDAANDRDMQRWMIGDVRAKGVKDFFAVRLQKTVHKSQDGPILNKDVQHAAAVEELAYHYEDAEKIGISQQIEREFMKVPDWLPVGQQYMAVFCNQAAGSYDKAAQILQDAGQEEFSGKLTELAETIRLDNGEQTGTALQPFTEVFVNNYHTVTTMTNQMLDPYGARDIPYAGENQDFLNNLMLLTRLADHTATNRLTAGAALKPVEP